MQRSFGVSLLALATVFAGIASAATVLRFDTEDLTDRAAVIVHGKVTYKQSRKTAKGSIVTDLRLEVITPVKGLQGKTFGFAVFGGVLGTRGSAISGAPTFELGEEVLVFLDREGKAGLRTPIGLAQGKFSIRVVNGKKLAFRDMEGLQLMDKKSRKVEDAKPDQGRPFTEVMDAIRKRIESAGKKAKK